MNQVFSGMGPTGRLHIGHYHGVLQNWCKLQNEYRCYFMIADLAALTTLFKSVDIIKNSIWEMLVDWIAAGVDPEKATIFIQSCVPEQMELAWLLSMSTPLSWLEKISSYQEKATKTQNKSNLTLGLLADPVMQAADILAYKATMVPVGADQVEYLRVAGIIAQSFNTLYGKKNSTEVQSILHEPKALLTSEAELPGIDGKKMSKSCGNSILMRSSPTAIEKKVYDMIVARSNMQEPGCPDICPVFKFHRIYSLPSVCNTINNECQTGKINCTDCKYPLISTIIQEQEPMHERAEPYLVNPKLLKDIVDNGCDKARKYAASTILEVKESIGLSYNEVPKMSVDLSEK